MKGHSRTNARWAWGRIAVLCAFGGSALGACILPDYQIGETTTGTAGSPGTSTTTGGSGGAGGMGGAGASGGATTSGGMGGTGGATANGGMGGGAGATTGTGGGPSGGEVEWVATVTSLDSYAILSSISPSATGVIGGGQFQMDALFSNGGGTLTAHSLVNDGFAFRLNAAGQAEKILQVKGWMMNGGLAGVTAVAATPDGNTVVAGQFGGGVFFGGGLQVSSGAQDAFVAKLDSRTGNAIWFHTWGGLSDDSVQALAVFPNGDIAVAGFFTETVEFQSMTPITSVGKIDAFVTRLGGTDGTIQWLTPFGSDEDDLAYGVTVTGAGDVVVVGANGGFITLDSAYLDHGVDTKPNAFVLQLDGTSGAGKWGVGLGDASYQAAHSVAAGANNIVYVTGDFLGQIVFDQSFMNPDMVLPDMFVVKYDLDAATKVQWSNAYEVNAFQQGFEPKKAGMSIAARSGDGALVAGKFNGTANFGSEPVTPSDNQPDGFALRLNDDGTPRWVALAQGPGTQILSCAAFGPNGETYVGGHYGTPFQLGGFMLATNNVWGGFLAKLSP